MIDISGLIKVQPIHPGKYKTLFDQGWKSLLAWLLCAAATTAICMGITWYAFIGDDFTEIAIVILKVVPALVFGLGMFCELMNWHNWKMRKALYYADLKEDLQEKRMVLNG